MTVNFAMETCSESLVGLPGKRYKQGLLMTLHGSASFIVAGDRATALIHQFSFRRRPDLLRTGILAIERIAEVLLIESKGWSEASP